MNNKRKNKCFFLRFFFSLHVLPLSLNNHDCWQHSQNYLPRKSLNTQHRIATPVKQNKFDFYSTFWMKCVYCSSETAYILSKWCRKKGVSFLFLYLFSLFVFILVFVSVTFCWKVKWYISFLYSFFCSR